MTTRANLRGATASPAGLLTILVVGAVFLLVALLVRERTAGGAPDPASRRAVREAVETLRALPPGSPLLAVRRGERSATRSGEIVPMLGGQQGSLFEWTVQPLRWEVAEGRWVACAGDERHELVRVAVRLRAPEEAGFGTGQLRRVLASFTFVRVEPGGSE